MEELACPDQAIGLAVSFAQRIVAALLAQSLAIDLTFMYRRIYYP